MDQNLQAYAIFYSLIAMAPLYDAQLNEKLSEVYSLPDQSERLIFQQSGGITGQLDDLAKEGKVKLSKREVQARYACQKAREAFNVWQASWDESEIKLADLRKKRAPNEIMALAQDDFRNGAPATDAAHSEAAAQTERAKRLLEDVINRRATSHSRQTEAAANIQARQAQEAAPQQPRKSQGIVNLEGRHARELADLKARQAQEMAEYKARQEQGAEEPQHLAIASKCEIASATAATVVPTQPPTPPPPSTRQWSPVLKTRSSEDDDNDDDATLKMGVAKSGTTKVKAVRKASPATSPPSAKRRWIKKEP